MQSSDKQLLTFTSTCILLAGIWCVSFASDCVPPYGYNGCACSYGKDQKDVNDTKFVNLLPLKINSSSPRFTVKDDKEWYYSYSPCGVFNEFVGDNYTRPGDQPCIKASVARWTNESIHQCQSLGDEEHAKFESTSVGADHGFIRSNLTLVFRSSKREHHSAKISLICNENMTEDETTFKYVNTTNTPTDTYYFALTSRCCCAGMCGIPPVIIPTTSPSSGPHNPLEAWKIAVIVAGVIIILLLVSGMVYCCKKKSQYEMV